MFQDTRFDIDHWIMVRLNLANHYIGYFDTAEQDPGDKYLQECCNLAMRLMKLSFTHQGLDVFSNKFTYHREKVRKHFCSLVWIF